MENYTTSLNGNDIEQELSSKQQDSLRTERLYD